MNQFVIYLTRTDIDHKEWSYIETTKTIHDVRDIVSATITNVNRLFKHREITENAPLYDREFWACSRFIQFDKGGVRVLPMTFPRVHIVELQQWIENHTMILHDDTEGSIQSSISIIDATEGHL